MKKKMDIFPFPAQSYLAAIRRLRLACLSGLRLKRWYAVDSGVVWAVVYFVIQLYDVTLRKAKFSKSDI